MIGRLYDNGEPLMSNTSGLCRDTYIRRTDVLLNLSCACCREEIWNTKKFAS